MPFDLPFSSKGANNKGWSIKGSYEMIVTPVDQRFILDATLIGPKDFDKTKTYGFVFALGST